MDIDCPRLQSFIEFDFNRWKFEVISGMRLLKVDYVIYDKRHVSSDDDKDAIAWKHDNLLCKLYLLSNMGEYLARSYDEVDSAKEIWESLEKQYKDEEKLSKIFKEKWESRKKKRYNDEEMQRSTTYLVGKFNDFKFEDDLEVLPQVEELEKLVTKMRDKNISLCDTYISVTIIYKLPPSWMSFSNKMLRKKKQVSLETLKRYIFMEDESRTRYRNELIARQKAAANLVSSTSNVASSSKGKKKMWRKSTAQNSKVPKKKFKRADCCFKCGETGHWSRDCKMQNKDRQNFWV